MHGNPAEQYLDAQIFVKFFGWRKQTVVPNYLSQKKIYPERRIEVNKTRKESASISLPIAVTV